MIGLVIVIALLAISHALCFTIGASCSAGKREDEERARLLATEKRR